MNKISLIHGEGGASSHSLIKNLFYHHFSNNIILKDLDAAIIDMSGRIAFTTDSYVVKPLFFKGGNIGSLAVYGTVNDLVVSAAKPLFLSCGFIIEEGFDYEELEKIVQTMKIACEKANVKIITGDTKVVPKHEIDGLFINTTGIGLVENNYHIKDICEDDIIIITGTIAEHGTTILNERYLLNVKGDIKSDSAPLTPYLEIIKPFLENIKIMRDPTRGGLASILNEFATLFKHEIEIEETRIPIRNEVQAINQLLGIDPLYLACEGRMIIIVEKDYAKALLKALKIQNINASVIGRVMNENQNANVYLKTRIGGRRLISPLEHIILPRIC